MPQSNTALAYAEAYQDPITGGYPLGHGYRMYLPGLMRFSAPDDCSPFGSGGINPYAYCAGDPVNRVDPSGHFGLGALLFAAFNVLMLVPDAIPGLDEATVPLQLAMDASMVGERATDVALGAAEASAAAARAMDESAASSERSAFTRTSALRRGPRIKPRQTVHFPEGTPEAPEEPTATYRNRDAARRMQAYRERQMNKMDWERAPERSLTFEDYLADAQSHLDRAEFDIRMKSKNLLPSRSRAIYPDPEAQLHSADRSLAAANRLRARFDRPGPSLNSLHEHQQALYRYSTLKNEVDAEKEPFAFDDANAAWRQFEESSEDEL